MSPQRVRLTIPKFKAEQSFELSKVLTDMGMGSAFNEGEADFSGINGKKNLYIGAVIHKTFLEVGEEGTEAAAATAVIMTKTSIAPEKDDLIEFKADRPFIYIIRDNLTEAILFIGRYTKP
jgi:serpin B